MGEKSLSFNNLLATWKKLAAQYNIAWKNSFIQWELPPNITADFALTLALPISHKTKQKPPKIAKQIIKITDCLDLEYTITTQGYINFRLPTAYYQQFLNKTLIQTGQNFWGEKKNFRLNIEYVSANPTGYLHLAHFRHAVVGNTLANIYQFCGYPITREYYINDRGGQITSLINSIYHFYHQLQNVTPTKMGQIEYAGEASQEIARQLITKWDSKYINRELNKEDFITWKKEILELILARIRQDLEKCGVKFDVWFSEASLYEKKEHLELLTELEKKDLVYTQNGATFFRSSRGGDDKDRVIIKQDGDYTYFFSDILYHLNKSKRADKLINIWGADHHGTIARLKSAYQLLGHKPENLQIILVQTVNLLTKDGPARFSKRAGNTIELAEALKYLQLDQLKLFLLEKDPNQPLSINTELLKENQEKTRLYYIQYAHARCHQIFQKANEKNIERIGSGIDLLTDQAERSIFNLLIRFVFVLENVIEENKSHHLINYLYELARIWQIYYQNSIILESESPELTSQKLLLVKNIQIILKLGLELMEIKAPERM
ncbi:Arginine--tRNA ligase [endosymbiont DhMRE of Dentiscutata heterogama]|uniref:arginine--tRNA ligase n=1 Tax=endosymbiont DhMRE of Dentiscutata heterogama TaxID=1609546 RepID=UPI000629D271|nr:arginine--tRNA ligase [endosymbiont DhMRE of Dentiscutata heterogama]CFW92761.1 Arginine--tRNA ligase [endosymbiont DhMRE of Dentiscutata heterogama]